MDDLVQWLRAQLDEDERIAKEAGGRRGQWRLARPLDDAELGDASWLRPPYLKHVERHDPARVLAEIDAKRRILYLAVQLPKVTASTDMFDNNRDAWAEVLKQLAAPYAGRPGYKPEWRP